MTRFCILVSALWLAVGCGESGPKRAPVWGTVSVDGKPLERGVINFFPVDGTTGPSAGGPIKDGAFDLDDREGPVVGTNRVEIRGFRKTGKTYRDEMFRKDVDVEVQVVPPEYNERSQETRTIQAGGTEIHFKLPGIPAEKSAK